MRYTSCRVGNLLIHVVCTACGTDNEIVVQILAPYHAALLLDLRRVHSKLWVKRVAYSIIDSTG